VKVIVGAAIVIVALLLFGMFRRKGWKTKPKWGPDDNG
jgi:hypothetical protein